MDTKKMITPWDEEGEEDYDDWYFDSAHEAWYIEYGKDTENRPTRIIKNNKESKDDDPCVCPTDVMMRLGCVSTSGKPCPYKKVKK